MFLQNAVSKYSQHLQQRQLLHPRWVGKDRKFRHIHNTRVPFWQEAHSRGAHGIDKGKIRVSLVDGQALEGGRSPRLGHSKSIHCLYPPSYRVRVPNVRAYDDQSRLLHPGENLEKNFKDCLWCKNSLLWRLERSGHPHPWRSANWDIQKVYDESR